MPNIMVQGWARAPAHGSSGYALHQQQDASISLTGRLKAMRLLIARSQQRGALADLIELDERMLRDIGVSRDAAWREAAKPFWRR